MSQILEYVVLDVFTERRYKGNPLAIVELPHSDALTQEQKQTVAAEFNLSETVFLHAKQPLETDSGSHQQRADIFTTDTELPFAGHPTVGTAVYIATQNQTLTSAVLNIKAGPTDLTFTRDSSSIRADANVPHDVHIHQAALTKSDLEKLQPNLSHHLPAARSYPLVSICNGMNFVLIQLDSIEALDAVETASPTQLNAFLSLDDGWEPSLIGAYYYVLREEETTTNPPQVIADARMILGLLEDAATGSAACTLSTYLALKRRDSGSPAGTTEFRITQGVKMGRESHIGVTITTDAKAITAVRLSGTAVQIMKGEIVV